MGVKNVKKAVKLSKDDNAIIQESLNKIKEVLKKKNINIKNTIGLVAIDDIEETSKQVEIRFAEEKMNVQMNMIAFD